MVVYIKKDVPNNFVILDLELDNNLYSNIGITFSDYLLNFWVKLSDELIEFFNNNKSASVEEVWNMLLNESNQDLIMLANVKEDAIKTIELYDISNAVNGFILNDSIHTWFTVEQRLNYKQSIEAAKLLGETSLLFLVEGVIFEISINQAEYMLAQILRYADKCYMITEQHKANINKMNSVELIKSYDYTLGYPDMLKFKLS